MDSEITKFDKNMSAVTFAEAGEFETATEFLQEEQAEVKPVKSPVVKKKPYGGMIIFGAISLAGYFLLITNQKLVTEVYTMGGWHAVYPVGTALIFSFIHGAFASNLLSVIGLEAKKH
jgi:hypothetical protein